MLNTLAQLSIFISLIVHTMSNNIINIHIVDILILNLNNTFLIKPLIYFMSLIYNTYMICSKKIIIVIIVSLIILFVGIGCILNKQTIEGLSDDSTTPCSCEALQTVASLYNDKDMKVTNLTVTDKFNLLPKGIIVAWTGKTDATGAIITTAPDGWALCDGSTTGVPDLRGKFIFGYGKGQGSAMNKTGGKETVTLNVNQIPAHTHTVKIDDMPCTSATCQKTVNHRFTAGVGYQVDYKKQPYPTNSVGKGQAHENMPPYYVLAYIMKL